MEGMRIEGCGFTRNLKSSCSSDGSHLIADPDLWRKFEGLPSLKGLNSNVITVWLSTDTTNEINAYSATLLTRESELGMELCHYLFNNGIRRVSLLCNSRDQSNLLYNKCIPAENELGLKVTFSNEQETDVTVVVLLPGNGQVQQRRMFLLVQDAFRKSTAGVVIIASESVFERVSEPLWQQFLDHFEKKGLWKKRLDIVCSRHNMGKSVGTGRELKTSSLLGGCNYFCGEMDCGHQCPYLCHGWDLTHSSPDFRCKRKCQRLCDGGHECRKLCWEDCGDCFYVLIISDACIHRIIQDQQVFCHEKDSLKCSVLVRRKLSCGHFTHYICSEQPNEFECEEEIKKTFACGHTSVLPCSQVREMGDQMLWKCQKFCGNVLSCGHPCPRACHLDDPEHKLVKCLRSCKRMCRRGIHRCCDWGNKHLCGDHERAAPCSVKYEFKLACRHALSFPCHRDDPDENVYRCTQSCQRIRAFCGHQCKKLCWEECGPCEEVLVTNARCPRNHKVQKKCQELVPRCERMVTVPIVGQGSCGHSIELKCYEVEGISMVKAMARCSAKCKHYFSDDGSCGHICQGTCRTCLQGRFHVRCLQPCDRTLICGHRCRNPCSFVCTPCSLPCENSCEHMKCELECGVPCTLDCDAPCSYFCKHSSCTRKCSEICDREPCFQDCPNLLKCGHPCIGYCGEECPPYCKFCDLDKLNVGLISGCTELAESDRFIYLSACGHCLEAEELEQWIKFSVSSKEVLPLRCPICLTTLKMIKRFSAAFHENRKTVNRVRTAIFGDDEEISRILETIKTRIFEFSVEKPSSDFESVYKYIILDELERPRLMASSDKPEFRSMGIQKARFLEWLTNEGIEVAKVVGHFADMVHFTPMDYTARWEKYLELIFYNERAWPLHPNEMRDLRQERRRLDDGKLLYSMFLPTATEQTTQFLITSVGQQMLAEAESILWKTGQYTEIGREKYLEKLQDISRSVNSVLNISEEERQEIVQAFGNRAGRWFKCANGHIYVITECGGPTQIDFCYICNCPIGGSNHRLLANNYLSFEMDNADAPLYPTALQREEEEE